MKKIREDFNGLRGRLLKHKMKQIIKNLYEIEKKKIFLNQKQQRLKKIFFELEESLFRLKKYYDYDDTEYKGIRDIKNLQANKNHKWFQQ